MHRFYGARLVYDMDSSLSDQLTESWTLLRPLRRVFEAIERRFIWRSSLVLAVCEDLAAKVRPWLGDAPVIVLPDVPMGDGALAAVEPLRNAGDDRLVALYVGNLERYQGIDLLLESLAQLEEAAPLRTIVIGGTAKHVRHYQ